MALELPLMSVPGIIAGEDLTAAQFNFVTLDSDGDAVLVDGANQTVFGILQNEPDTGEQCEIMVAGISKVKVDGSGFDAGDPIICDANAEAGTVSVSDNTEAHQVLGVGYDDASADAIGSIMFNTLQGSVATS